MDHFPSDRRLWRHVASRPETSLLFLVFVTVATHWAGMAGGFMIDAHALLEYDYRVTQHTWSSVLDCFRYDYWWTSGRSFLYRPLTTLSFLANHWIWPAPIAFKLVNLGIHLGSGLLLWRLLRRVVTLPWATVGAAAFLMHPVSMEVVCSVVGRSDLMVAAATFGAALLLSQANGAPGAIVAGGVAGLGVWFKESAVLALPIAIGWLWIAEGRAWRQCVQRASWAIASAAVVVTGYLWLRHFAVPSGAQQGIPFVDNPLAYQSTGGRIVGALDVISRLLGHVTLLNWNLACDYSYPQIVRGEVGGAALGGLLLIGLLCGPVLFGRTALAWGCWMVPTSLLVTSNLLLPIGSVMADRFVYLATAGFAVALAAVFYRLWEQRTRTGPDLQRPFYWPSVAVTVAVLGVTGGIAVREAKVWSSEVLLWARAIEVSPQSFRTHSGLAEALLGVPEARELARGEAQVAVTLLSDLPDDRNCWAAYMIAARVERDCGLSQEAVGAYEAAVRIDGAHASLAGRQELNQALYVEFAGYLAGLNRGEEALANYRRAVRCFPLAVEAYEGVARFTHDRHEKIGALAAAALVDRGDAKRWSSWNAAVGESGMANEKAVAISKAYFAKACEESGQKALLRRFWRH